MTALQKWKALARHYGSIPEAAKAVGVVASLGYKWSKGDYVPGPKNAKRIDRAYARLTEKPVAVPMDESRVSSRNAAVRRAADATRRGLEDILGQSSPVEVSMDAGKVKPKVTLSVDESEVKDGDTATAGGPFGKWTWTADYDSGKVTGADWGRTRVILPQEAFPLRDRLIDAATGALTEAERRAIVRDVFEKAVPS